MASVVRLVRTDKNLQTLGYFLVFVAVGMTTASLGPSIPSFARNTGSTLSAVGALFVFHRIGYIVGSLSGGRLLDRWPGNVVTGVMVLVIALGLVIVPTAGTVVALFSVLFVLGLAQGTCEVGANTGVVWLHGKRAGPAMNGLHLSFGIGAIVAPVVITVSLESFNTIVVGYWLLAGLAAGSGVLIFRTPAARRFQGAEAVDEGRRQVSRVTVALLAVLLFFTIAGEAGFSGWVYSYARSTELAGGRVAGYLTSAFWGALTVGRLAGIAIVARLGARRFLLLSVVGCVLAMALLVLVPDMLVVLSVAAVLLGLAQSSIVPLTFTLAGELQVLNGVVGGILVASSSAGASILPWLIGRGFESIGPEAFVWFVGMSQVASLAAVVVLFVVSGKRFRNVRHGGQK